MNLKHMSTSNAEKNTFGPQISHSAITGHKGYELNNVFYVIIVELLNLISLINIIFKIKYLIELNDFVDIYSILQKFYPLCINLFVIVVLTVLFLRYSLVSVKCENLATNGFQLGDDLILINEENENFKPRNSHNTTTTTYFAASLTQSSTSSESSISPTPSSTFESAQLDGKKLLKQKQDKLSICEKVKFYTKFYFLPTNIVLHLITCLVILLTKMLISMNLNEILDKNQNTTFTILNTNNTITVSSFVNLNSNRYFQVFGLTELQNLFYNNQILINIDYFNYFFALLMFMINISRVYIKLNSFFAIILIINLFIYMIQNLFTILTIDYILTIPISTSQKSSNWSEKSGIAFIKIIIKYVFDNKLFILISYLLSWLFNLIYYTAFNIYCIYFYNKAHLKLISKYKCYLNRYYNFYGNNTPSASSSSSSSTASTASTASTSSSASSTYINETCFTGSHVFSQYKAIIFGIVILLLIEVLQIPYLFNCYSNYNAHICYLIALLVQLIYLLLNAFIWIILTLKHKWKLNFTLKFQILLWHTLFYNYLNEYYGSMNPNPNIHTSTAKNEHVDVDNQNLQVKMLLMRKQQQIPKSFVNVISSTNDRLNSMDKNRLIINDGNNCYDNNLVNNLSNDNRSDTGTTSSILSQQTTNFKARVINCNQSQTTQNVNKQTQNPAIAKKIAQMNRNKKLIQADPRQYHQQQQLRNVHTNSSSNLVTSWNEFIVNEHD